MPKIEYYDKLTPEMCIKNKDKLYVQEGNLCRTSEFIDIINVASIAVKIKEDMPFENKPNFLDVVHREVAYLEYLAPLFTSIVFPKEGIHIYGAENVENYLQKLLNDFIERNKNENNS